MLACQLFGCLTGRWTCNLPGWLPAQSPFCLLANLPAAQLPSRLACCPLCLIMGEVIGPKQFVLQSRRLQCWCFVFNQSGMSHGAEILIPASFSNQFTTLICVFCSGIYAFLRKTPCWNCQYNIYLIILTLQIYLYRFYLSESEKIFRHAYNVILITVSISTELSFNPSHKVLMNSSMDS